MDHRAVRLALGLTIAGASMLTAGVATWLITAIGRVTSGAAARDLRLAALACWPAARRAGWRWGSRWPPAAPGRAARAGRPGGRPASPAGPGEPRRLPSPWPSPRSLMNPPPPSPPPPWSQEQWSQEQWSRRRRRRRGRGRRREAGGSCRPGITEPADRVWWRAAHSPAGGWDDTSEEWLRSLRGPAIQQPPPHSAE